MQLASRDDVSLMAVPTTGTVQALHRVSIPRNHRYLAGRVKCMEKYYVGLVRYLTAKLQNRNQAADVAHDAYIPGCWKRAGT